MRIAAPLASALLTLTAAPAFAEEATPGVHTFEAVDAFANVGVVGFEIIGVPQGGTAATTLSFHAEGGHLDLVLPGCERMALIAMNKPGAYVFSVEVEAGFTPTVRNCTLKRRP